jgi:hypothetical protein
LLGKCTKVFCYIFTVIDGYFCVILLSNNISVTWSRLSCIPLYNFSYTYDYIMSTSRSFVDRWVVQSLNKCLHLISLYTEIIYVCISWVEESIPAPFWFLGLVLPGVSFQCFYKNMLRAFSNLCVFYIGHWLIFFWQLNAGISFADTKEGRYNPKMASVIPVHNWRKGSQVRFQFIGLLLPEAQLKSRIRTKNNAWNFQVDNRLLVWLVSFLCLLAVGCPDQKACRGCCGRQYCLSYVSTALQGKLSSNYDLWLDLREEHSLYCDLNKL